MPLTAVGVYAWLIPKLGLNFSQQAAFLAKSDWLAEEYSRISPTFSELIRLIYQSAFSLLISRNIGGETAQYYNSNLWTMPIEFLGSVGLFTFYKLFLTPFVPYRTGQLILVSALVYGLWNTPFYGFPVGACLFIFQELIGSYQIEWRNPVRHAALASVGLASLLGGLILGGTPFELNLPDHGFYASLALAINPFTMPLSAITVMHNIGACLLVISVILFAPVQRALESRLFQFLGKISFMVYLLQVPILCSLCAWIVLTFTPQLGYNSAVCAAALAYMMTLIPLACAFTILFDIPAIRASRVLGRFIDTATASWKFPLR